MAANRWRTEDWVAVYVGFFIIIVTLLAFSGKWIDFSVFTPNLRWTTDGQVSARVPGWAASLDDVAKEATAKNQADNAQRANTLKDALQKGDRAAIGKAAAELAKAGRNTVPGALATEIRAHAGATTDRVFTWDNLSKIVYIGIAWLIVAAVGYALLGGKVAAFIVGFPAIFVMAWIARLLAGNGLFIEYGIEYVIFALALGLLVSNTIGVPRWLKP